MDKIIILTKIIRGLAASSIIFGLAACSSTPAPWTQAEDSPWGAKHSSEQEDMAAEEGMSDTSLSDPILLADSEPEPELIVMLEPEMAAEPEMIIPVIVEELSIEQEIMALPGSSYAVQVYAGKTVESVERFKNNKDLAELEMVKTDRSGSIVYVLLDIHTDRSAANAAAVDLETKTGSKPWVRSIAGLQKIVAE